MRRSGNRFRWSLRLGTLTLLPILVYWGCFAWVKIGEAERLARAERLIISGDRDAARNALTWLLWFEPDHDAALMLLGHSYRLEGDLPKAAGAFRRVPVQSASHREASRVAAFAWLNSGRLTLCEEAFRNHLKRYPDSRDAYIELKWLFYNQFRERELEELFRRQLARKPADFLVLLDALYTEIREQVAEEAVVALRKADRVCPNQAPVLLALAFCHWQLGDLPTARDQFKHTLELRPNHVGTRLTVAEFLLEQNRVTEAGQLIQVSETENPFLVESFSRDDRWWWLTSKLALRSGELQRGLELLDSALKLRPFELSYLQARGQLLQSLGQTGAAGDVFQQIYSAARAEQRLLEIVLSEELEDPTPELCREVARLYTVRGRTGLASGWQKVAAQLTRTGASSVTNHEKTPAAGRSGVRSTGAAESQLPLQAGLQEQT